MTKQYHHTQNPRLTANRQHNSAAEEAKQLKPVFVPATCGTTQDTLTAHYGALLDPPVFENQWRRNPEKDVSKAVTRAYGCSAHKDYCTGEPQAIPCCTKIMFDMWHALDAYLTKYNVTYGLRWGSLLFAVRNGMHMSWDTRDVDIGFMRPVPAAEQAIAEFQRDFDVISLAKHALGGHIGDVRSFYEAHHAQYGYPPPDAKRCFVNNEYTTQIEEFQWNDTLQLAGYAFLDYGLGDDGAGGMALDNAPVAVSYVGSNGILPPRELYVPANYYRHLNTWYGNWKWTQIKPEYISEQQFRYHGHDERAMKKYWRETRRATIEALGPSTAEAQVFVVKTNVHSSSKL